ncbi:hypothetical protein PGT21_008085 [Puccinia graminis f. sp. tritici]|uniref:Uncharacterized protein n=1 Tax=Puccinia graminis f. sp. tritici TaxID=56615 RepID=A0A5B0M573_PUCGR|nr:hypothetical protein PGT21_008085 [Puccinia graminis f. sp. tritici]
MHHHMIKLSHQLFRSFSSSEKWSSINVGLMERRNDDLAGQTNVVVAIVPIINRIITNKMVVVVEDDMN